jgi:hypothetical protein
MAEQTVPAPCNHVNCAQNWLFETLLVPEAVLLIRLYDEYLAASHTSIQARLRTPWVIFWWRAHEVPAGEAEEETRVRLHTAFSRYSNWVLTPQEAWHTGADFHQQAELGEHAVCLFTPPPPTPPAVIIDLVSDSDTELDDPEAVPRVWIRRTRRRTVPRDFNLFITRSDNLNSEESCN